MTGKPTFAPVDQTASPTPRGVVEAASSSDEGVATLVVVAISIGSVGAFLMILSCIDMARKNLSFKSYRDNGAILAARGPKRTPLLSPELLGEKPDFEIPHQSVLSEVIPSSSSECADDFNSAAVIPVLSPRPRVAFEISVSDSSDEADDESEDGSDDDASDSGQKEPDCSDSDDSGYFGVTILRRP